jgi:hypothetical protein
MTREDLQQWVIDDADIIWEPIGRSANPCGFPGRVKK